MTVGEPYQPADRRPIAARNISFFARVAGTLARAGVSANTVSVAGLFFGIAAGFCLARTSVTDSADRLVWIAAAALIQLRLLMNMLDGMVAIESKSASRLGELYNEIPDRISDAATLIGLGYADGGHIGLGYIAACMAMLVAYIRAAGKIAGAHQEFCGPMAKPHRMLIVTLAALYCGFGPSSWQPHLDGFEHAGVAALALAIIIAGCAITAVRRLARIRAALVRSAP